MRSLLARRARLLAADTIRAVALTLVMCCGFVTTALAVPVPAGAVGEATTPIADPYGYLMVHFLEDSAGFAERIYLDVSDGDSPTSWTPVNQGRPILASDLGASGVRDPYLVQNPQTGTYYIIATDLRVFNQDGQRVTDCPSYAPSGYCPWYQYRHLSRDLVVWESQDLVHWGEPRSLTVADPTAGRAWAPEATWVEDYDGQGHAGFVLYWSSNTFASDDPQHQGPSQSDTLFGFTGDFTQADFDDRNPDGAQLLYRASVGDVIDTSIHQYTDAAGRLVTYRAYKQNNGNAQNPTGITFTSTTSKRWWEAGTEWTVLSTGIGNEYGSVEAPLFFKENSADRWYLFVDQYGGSQQGYRPYASEDISTGVWKSLGASAITGMKTNTKHGAVLPLTRSAYESVRAADVIRAVSPDPIHTESGVAPDLPPTVRVATSDGASRAEAVEWESIDPESYATDGVFSVAGTIAAGYPGQLSNLATPQTSMEAPADGWGLTADEPTRVKATVRVGSGSEVRLDPRVDLSFDDATSGLQGGVAQAHEHGTRASAPGRDETPAARLSNTYWLDVSTSQGAPVLTGLDDLTISYDSRPSASGNAGWAVMAERNTTGNVYRQEHYLGTLDRVGQLTVERYDNHGTRDTSGNLAATSTGAGWKHVAIVLDGHSGRLYVDGRAVATKEQGALLSDILGPTGGTLQLGKADWGGGEYFTGLLDNLRVYDRALDADGLALDAARAALSIGDLANVTSDLTLPSSTGDGEVSVTWKSDSPDIVTDTGRVHGAEEDATVHLVASLTRGTYATDKTFTVHVPARPATAREAAAALQVPYALQAGTLLPERVGGVTGTSVSWTSSDQTLVTDGGEVVGGHDGSGLSEVDLLATVVVGDDSASKKFRVLVSEAHPGVVTGYTTTPAGKLASSMHLALDDSSAGSGWAPLNLGQGVLFARSDYQADPLNGVAKQLTDPYLLRDPAGGFRVLATQTNLGEAADPTATNKALMFTSADLIDYDQVGLVTLPTDAVVSRPAAEFDALRNAYRVTWTEPDGSTWGSWTEDFESFEVARPNPPLSSISPHIGESATGRNIAVLTRAERDRLERRFTRVVNTTVDGLSPIFLDKGSEAPSADMLGRASANYSDGSQAQVPVEWDPADLAAVDTATPGTYEVEGTLRTLDTFPLIGPARADPYVFRYQDSYYFIATTENEGQRKLYMYQADSLAGLADASPHLIQDDGNLAWAPEVHQIAGRLYLNYATGPVWNQVKSTVVRMTDGGDPTDPRSWDFAHQRTVTKAPGGGSPVALQPNGITLDMTYFSVGGTWYAIWSDRVVTPKTGSADLKIATFDPEDPSVLTSEPVTISRPDYGWDSNTAPVDEGAFALVHDGTVTVTFSGSGVDSSYAIGELTADEDADLLDPLSWTKANAPILTSVNVPGQAGPGHNSYLTTEDGVLVSAFHADSGGRHAGVRVAHWGALGNLVLDMTADRQVLEGNRRIVRQVVVEPSWLTAPTLSQPGQVWNTTDPARLTVAVTGDRSGWVTFLEGSRVIGRAPITDGAAVLPISPTLSPGPHWFRARMTVGATTQESPRSGVFKVRRAGLTSLELAGPADYVPHEKFRVTVSAGALTNQRPALGRLVVRVGRTHVRTIRLTQTSPRSVPVTIPAELVSGAQLRITARYLPDRPRVITERATALTLHRR